jgi:hypothetical protein
VLELYEQFAKLSKFDIQHLYKREQQRKISKPDEALRPHHNESQRSYPKPVHNIDSNGCGPSENWEKIMGHHHNKQTRAPPPTRDLINIADVVEARIQLDLHTA